MGFPRADKRNIGRIVSTLLGALLLAAGGLKLCGLNVSAVPRAGPLAGSGLQLAAASWEVVLGLWLVSGGYRIGAWLAALATFLAFAGTSGYLGWIGQADCGCFGSVKASPWYACAVDVAAVLLLALGSPNLRDLRTWDGIRLRAVILRGLALAAAIVVLVTALLGLVSLRFGSADAALAYLRGERVSVRPDLLDVGRGEQDQLLEGHVLVINRTEQPVRIVGGTSDCSCVATADLPLVLAPGEAREVSVRVRLGGAPGYFNRKAYFWTDCSDTRFVAFDLVGRIDPPARESAAVGVK